MQVSCTVCDSRNVVVICDQYRGYLEKALYTIYQCQVCNSQFVISQEATIELYDGIYSSGEQGWYGRYYEYANVIKSKRDPLKFLTSMEPTYWPVYKFVKDKRRDLRILEVGCGYGYLSYSLLSRGFSVTGIDVSDQAITFAREHFGEHFANESLESYEGRSREQFDLIIATEVIEHLTNPSSFLGICTKLLKQDGALILTTPNRDFYPKSALWKTDLPPIHLAWLSKKGIALLAQRNGLIGDFTNFSNYFPRSYNRLAKYFWARRNTFLDDRVGSSCPLGYAEPSERRPRIHRLISHLLHRQAGVRQLSNWVYNIFIGDEDVIGVVLRKNVQNAATLAEVS